MKTRSLHLRLTLAAIVAIFVALAVSWAAMTWLFERHLERKVVTDLMRDAKPLLANLTLSTKGEPQAPHPPVDPRFHIPDSGLYWQLTTDSGRLRSRSLWDQALPASAHATASHWSTDVVPGPFGHSILLLQRRVRAGANSPQVLIQLAHEQATLTQARDAFGRDLVLYMILLWAVLSTAAIMQIRLGLSPLRRLRQQLPALREDPQARLSGEHPAEIQPLLAAINDLASTREEDLTRARRRAADLAHSLKTPLAALAAQSRSARRAGASVAAEGLDMAIAAVSAAIDAELARSRVAGARRQRPISPLRAIERVIGVIERTAAGERLVFEVTVPNRLEVPVAEDNLMELLGALIENATRYARWRIRISGCIENHRAILAVEDDGPGLDTAHQEKETTDLRLDEAGSGHQGLGLVIVRDLLNATAGDLMLEHSPLGGLKAAMSWPEAAFVTQPRFRHGAAPEKQE